MVVACSLIESQVSVEIKLNQRGFRPYAKNKTGCFQITPLLRLSLKGHGYCNGLKRHRIGFSPVPFPFSCLSFVFLYSSADLTGPFSCCNGSQDQDIVLITNEQALFGFCICCGIQQRSQLANHCPPAFALKKKNIFPPLTNQKYL